MKILVFENDKFVEKNLNFPFKDTRTRNEKIVDLIRCKYSLDEELAIQRQRDSKPQEFKEYFDYCELCKKTVKDRVAEQR